MTTEQINTSIRNERLSLTLGQKESHYAFVFVCFIPLIISIFFLIKDSIMGTESSIHPDFRNILIGGIILGIIAFIWQYNRLKFIVFETVQAQEKMKELINEIEKKEWWRVDSASASHIIVKTKPPLKRGSWGEQISIMFDKNRILVNSICDPDNMTSLTSFGRNKANVEIIRRIIVQKPLTRAKKA